MSIILDYTKVCAVLATRSCFDSGATVKEIAKDAGRSVSTIYRWLTLTKSKY